MERLNRIEPTRIDALDYIQRTGNEMLHASRRIAEALRPGNSAAGDLPFQFPQALGLVARMIAAEVPTRVFYVTLDGFDTHANQSIRHAALLQEFSEALAAFHRHLKASGHHDRTLVMTFSEFGRRLTENRSRGTDHGTGNVMFLLGGSARPGMHGPKADLTRLDAAGGPHHAGGLP
jgi:uncharacterized protein (DUF1501 family)